MKTALTIAGSDSSGGAGIQADLKTFMAHGVFGMSVITSVTAQNTCGVFGIQDIDEAIVTSQLDAVFSDIYPDCLKIGMVSDKKIIDAIAESLKKYDVKKVVLDPVMVSTSGSPLLKEDALESLTENLFPLALLVTPNIPEAQILSGMEINSRPDMEKAASVIAGRYGCAVLVKGGHFAADAPVQATESCAARYVATESCAQNASCASGELCAQNASCADFLLAGDVARWFEGERIDNKNTHGTGCTLSSAICSNLALGKGLEQAVLEAKDYVSGAIKSMLNLGRGRGPLNHGWKLTSE